MTYQIENIDGLGEDLRARLRDAGVRTTAQLLSRWNRDRDKVRALAGDAGADLRKLLCMADLLRINGVGEAYAMLLYTAGVRSAAALVRASASELWDALGALALRMPGVKRRPSLTDVKDWIRDSEGLPPLDH